MSSQRFEEAEETESDQGETGSNGQATEDTAMLIESAVSIALALERTQASSTLQIAVEAAVQENTEHMKESSAREVTLATQTAREAALKEAGERSKTELHVALQLARAEVREEEAAHRRLLVAGMEQDIERRVAAKCATASAGRQETETVTERALMLAVAEAVAKVKDEHANRLAEACARAALEGQTAAADQESGLRKELLQSFEEQRTNTQQSHAREVITLRSNMDALTSTHNQLIEKLQQTHATALGAQAAALEEQRQAHAVALDTAVREQTAALEQQRQAHALAFEQARTVSLEEQAAALEQQRQAHAAALEAIALEQQQNAQSGARKQRDSDQAAVKELANQLKTQEAAFTREREQWRNGAQEDRVRAVTAAVKNTMAVCSSRPGSLVGRETGGAEGSTVSEGLSAVSTQSGASSLKPATITVVDMTGLPAPQSTKVSTEDANISTPPPSWLLGDVAKKAAGVKTGSIATDADLQLPVAAARGRKGDPKEVLPETLGRPPARKDAEDSESESESDGESSRAAALANKSGRSHPRQRGELLPRKSAPSRKVSSKRRQSAPDEEEPSFFATAWKSFGF